MTSQEIRKQFIDFFKGKEHTFVRSAAVVPQDDPTLLFTNAGMNQFKDVFLNTGNRPYSRAVNSQKCIRVSGKHNDLEEVGHDTYHHTFFEMLGNWSFGDYYKKEAIQWAWELFTDVWKLPKDKLYATVYTTDDEAAELWAKNTDIKKEHILKYGDKDNFWEMGPVGPCGPCSEIHIDLGPDRCDKKDEEHICAVNGECGRYIELWNNPVPGMPTVIRLPLGPTVNFAPRGPNESELPDLLRFNVTPGAILILRQKRNDIVHLYFYQFLLRSISIS